MRLPVFEDGVVLERHLCVREVGQAFLVWDVVERSVGLFALRVLPERRALLHRAQRELVDAGQ